MLFTRTDIYRARVEFRNGSGNRAFAAILIIRVLVEKNVRVCRIEMIRLKPRYAF